ncbi:MAG: hypothetical protein J6M62_07820 [Selenomonadaceae bacterium]|nr:hypothetical protein [Selenomonadaceae bacterium]
MKKVNLLNYFSRSMVLVGILTCLCFSVAFAAEGDAITDWENAVIRGKGYGAPSERAKNPGHARILAHQAAMLDAYRRLAEQAKGIHITATSTIEDNISSGDIVVGEVDAVIKRAKVVPGSETYDEYGNCSVTLEVPLFGVNNSIAKLAFKPVKKVAFPAPNLNVSVTVENNTKTTVTPPNPAPVTPPAATVPTTPPSEPAPTMPAPASEPTPAISDNKDIPDTKASVGSSAAPAPKGLTAKGGFTGLIVDCRGLDLNPVMSPVIRNAQNEPIYGYKNLDYDKVVSVGMAGYAKNLNENTERAGKNPLVVKAIRVENNNSYPVISTEDANKVLVENSASHFLDNCAVVFVR